MKKRTFYSIAVSLVFLLTVQGLAAKETLEMDVALLKGQVPLLERPEIKETLKRAVAFGIIPFGISETI